MPRVTWFSLISGVHPIVSRTLSYGSRLRSCFIYRVLRLDVVLAAGAFAAGAAAAGFAVSAAMVLLAVAESRLMIVSPASGGASGCLKYTGRRIDTGTGWPRVFAGSNFRSLDPFIAAESSALNPDVSATRVESETIAPLLSM